MLAILQISPNALGERVGAALRSLPDPRKAEATDLDEWIAQRGNRGDS